MMQKNFEEYRSYLHRKVAAKKIGALKMPGLVLLLCRKITLKITVMIATRRCYGTYALPAN